MPFIFSLMDKPTAETIQACLDFAQREFDPEHVRLYVFPWNERAIRVYEQAGFQHIRVFLQRNMHGEHKFLEMSGQGR